MSLAFKLHHVAATRAPGRDLHDPHSRAILEYNRDVAASVDDPAATARQLVQRVRAVMWLLVGTVVLVDLLATFIFRAG